MAGIPVKSCEFLAVGRQSMSAADILAAMKAHCPVPFVETAAYQGRSDLLMLWGAGGAQNADAVAKQGMRRRRSICWDYGYFKREKRGGYLRVSIDDWHPQRWLDYTKPDPSRWSRLGISLRNDFDPSGPVILAGMGPKSHAFCKAVGWENMTLRSLQQRFPGKEIIFRPKPFRTYPPLACKIATDGPIEDLLQGASLVVCSHSNVAVDAIVAGVPFECTDGAAMWLQGKDFTEANRLDFLRRLAFWQWHHSEAAEAWDFLLGVLDAHRQSV